MMGEQPRKLNVGCGRRALDGYVNLDSVELPSVDVVCDVDTEQLPFEDDTFEEILMSHVLEHLPHPLHAMEELWRVAKPDAVCTVHVPYGSSDGAWEDPTHVRPYFHRSFGYFSQPYYWAADYGYSGDWQPEEVALRIRDASSELLRLSLADALAVVDRDRNVVREMVASLRAVKPRREAARELARLPRVRLSGRDAPSATRGRSRNAPRVLLAGMASHAGGVSKTARLVAAGLEEAGAVVRRVNILAEDARREGEDFCVFLGWWHVAPTIAGSSTGHGAWSACQAPLLQLLETSQDTPVMIASNWDGHPACAAWLLAKTEELRQRHSRWRWINYSSFVRDEPALAPIQDLLVELPHPVQSGAAFRRPASTRAGVCIGEITKLVNRRSIDAFDFEKVISESPHPVYAYNYYNRHAQVSIPGLTVESPPPHQFLEWLSQFRVFASLSRYESYNMVPCEAQSMGIPVAYRRMPQSLSERIGTTGIPCSTEADMLDAIQRIYTDDGLWAALSASGIAQSEARSPSLVGHTWLAALQRIRDSETLEKP